MPKLEYGVVIIISLWTLTYATFMQDALTENKSGSAVSFHIFVINNFTSMQSFTILKLIAITQVSF